MSYSKYLAVFVCLFPFVCYGNPTVSDGAARRAVEQALVSDGTSYRVVLQRYDADQTGTWTLVYQVANETPVAGDITEIRIASDGWYVEIDLNNFTTSGSYNLDPLATNIPSDMVIKFKVTSTGYDDNGNPITLDRYVYGTNFKRKIYPDDAQADESTIAGGVTVKIALSEWIYSTDIVQLEVMGAGAYNDGSNVQESRYLSVINNSAETHQKVVGNWSLPGFNLVGSSMELRCVAFHRSAQNGRPVRAVKFTVDDQHGNSASTVVTAATIANYQGLDALPIVEYIGTVDTSGLTDGDILTANFTAYPWYGTPLDTGDGLNAMPTPLYAPQYYVLDKSDTYGRTVAIVSTSGNDGSGVVVDVSSFDDQNPPAAFATIGAASNAIANYNNTNHSRNDSGGGIIYLREGQYQWAGSASVTNPDVWLTVKGFPGDIKSNIELSSAGGSKELSEKVKVEGINITSSTTITFDYMNYLWIHDCIFQPSGAAAVYRNIVSYWTNNELHTTGDYNPYSTTWSPRALFRGNTSVGTDWVLGYVVVGNDRLSEAAPYEHSMTIPFADNIVVAYNYFKRTTDAGILRAWAIGSENGSFVHGAAIVQNVIEKTVDGSVPAFQIAADQSSGDQSNVIIWHNNIVGQRTNMAYNDYNLNGLSPAYRNHWSVKHNIWDDLNVVTDHHIHGGEADAARYGNHAIYHGVGVAGNFDASRVGAGTAYRPKYQGIYGVDPAANTNPLYVDDQSSVGAAGGDGNYALQANSPAKGLIPAGQAVLPYDLNGYSRSNTGGGDIGAMLSGDE